MTRRQGVRLATLFTVVILAFYAFGYWQSRPAAPEPMAWYGQYQDTLLKPLQAQRLTLADAGAALGHGTLWMISAEGKPLLVSRHTMESDDLSWRVQAVIGLTPEQTESLVQAQAWQPELPDQPISSAVGDALKDRQVVRLSLIPNEPMSLAQVQGTFGNPDLRLPVSEGEAWVYPKEGAVVAVGEEQAHSIMFGLRDALPAEQ
ncbi:hypothetical protein [Halopseudomonas aestusnigri]|uniref:Uncharacterized protein n=1 Tax=Halopseudomonas aestusnigri TaxID=857252 RepID=A0AAQ1JQE1_9GAMM|nr:hypothetical protein [Halopseudomonas aestusnigri]OWL88034.1 hypothetical protein B7O88_11175 [Halopseudomonas aestusnigri]SEG44591.1 hypothetical protein SAMN05216586_10734 [Halopseudomonas aestusnigri]